MVVSSSRLSSLSLTMYLTHFHLSSAQLYHFHQVCNYWIPECFTMKSRWQILARWCLFLDWMQCKKTTRSSFWQKRNSLVMTFSSVYYRNINPLETWSRELNGIRFLLLNQINGLSFKNHIPEHELFKEFCVLQVTPKPDHHSFWPQSVWWLFLLHGW